MNIYSINPINDPRWTELLARDERATIFHSSGWLSALRETYGYKAAVLTTSAPSQPLANGVVFCAVRSRLTGRRLVSLPFSDHCEPLVRSSHELHEFVKYAAAGSWGYIELRPQLLQSDADENPISFRKCGVYWLHRLNLSPDLETIFHRFHKDCVQRKIRRAKKENVVYQEGNTPELLDTFYQLLLRTRRRHHLPPQPLDWFRNLVTCLGDCLKIRAASKGGKPIASIMTLTYKNTLMYKYGVSDERYHKFGGMQLLLWRAIQDAKNRGLDEFDMGRCDPKNAGLLAFKDRWGTTRSNLSYWRYQPKIFPLGQDLSIARRLFSFLPDRLQQGAGRILYKHIG